MSSFLAKIKNYYDLDEEALKARLKEPSFSLIPDISDCPCVKKAIARLKDAKEKGQKVIIYGDYDFDGISATSIILLALKEFGIEAKYYIPSRYNDGYGLNEENVKRIKEAHYDLIFTVDNGVGALKALAKAKEAGIDVIVLDHHSYVEEPKSIVTLIHPKTVGLDSLTISAGFLSYLFSVSLSGEKDPYYFLLGSTSLLSDSMPLLGYNHYATNLAISILNDKRNKEYLLLNYKEKYFASDLQMAIIPMINAIGRMEENSEVNRTVRFFVSNDLNEKEKLAHYFSKVNEERKTLTAEAEKNLAPDSNKKSIFVVTDLKEGLNGLLANKILGKYDKPVAVFSKSKKDENIYVGSLRSKKGFDVLEFLNSLSFEPSSKGGHSYAAGVSLKKEYLKAFSIEFEIFAANHPLIEEKKEPIVLFKDECLYENFELLEKLGPFGNSFEEPYFSFKIPYNELSYIKDGRYLSVKINQFCRLFSFKIGKIDISECESVTFKVKVNPNFYQGRLSFDLLAEEILKVN